LPAPDIRILADDLTGALDSAVAFAGGQGIGVTWHRSAVPGSRMAVDLGTREEDARTAVARNRALGSWLAAGDLRFKKIDSLLRGHVAAEIAACLESGNYRRTVIAPAFPFQGRITRDGRQWRARPAMELVGPDLTHLLARHARVATARPGEAPEAPIVFYDAATDADLDRIVDSEIGNSASTLWVGSGGLAEALSRRLSTVPTGKVELAAPFVGLIGTDHPVTRDQVDRFRAGLGEGCLRVEHDLPAVAADLIERMARGAPSLVSVAVSGDRPAAARRIEEVFAALLRAVPPPGTLLVTGGETLRSVCTALGGDRLIATGEMEPGLPVSCMQGGVRHGMTIVSKSGGFGRPDLLLRIVEPIA
jgi:uncharacterized protein YgbK (DUF1537 family)